jgi:hypothetical protein
VLEIFAHPRPAAGGVAGDDLGETAHAARRAVAGKSGGCGWVSSRYSMIASDWNSTGPSPSMSAGSTICGLTLRNASSRCLPLMRSTSMTSSGMRPLRLSAIRTR